MPWTRSWSQFGQDSFSHKILIEGLGVKSGTFLDLGCSQPFIDNNTYHLEELGFRGLLCDIYDVDADPNHRITQVRSSPFLCADAAKVNWAETLPKYGLQSPIDLLSFDIDGSTIEGVKNFPWDKYRFKVIQIEHDVYQSGPEPKRLIEETLRNYNYQLVCENVMHEGKKVDNWYVCPLQVPERVWKPFVCKDKEYTDFLPISRHEQDGCTMNIFEVL